MSFLVFSTMKLGVLLKFYNNKGVAPPTKPQITLLNNDKGHSGGKKQTLDFFKSQKLYLQSCINRTFSSCAGVKSSPLLVGERGLEVLL